MTEAFAAALEQLPRHWPRTHWSRVADDGRVEFHNGNFRLTFLRDEGIWQFATASENHAVRRRLWWLSQLLSFVLLFAAADIAGRVGWLWGWAAAFPVTVLAGFADQRARRLRRGGTRVPFDPRE